MAVPKQKTPKARRNTRNAAVYYATTETLTKCPQCHTARKPHTVCGNCGHYKGAVRIATEKDKKEKKSGK